MFLFRLLISLRGRWFVKMVSSVTRAIFRMWWRWEGVLRRWERRCSEPREYNNSPEYTASVNTSLGVTEWSSYPSGSLYLHNKVPLMFEKRDLSYFIEHVNVAYLFFIIDIIHLLFRLWKMQHNVVRRKNKINVADPAM